MSDRSDLVAKRLRYIERQRELHKERVNVAFEGRSPEGSGPDEPSRHAEAAGRPAAGAELAGARPRRLTGDRHRMRGASRSAAGARIRCTFTWEQFLELPQVEDVSDFHCVTTWSRMDNRWRGVRFRTIAELAVPAPDVTHVLCTGYDHMPGTRIPYTTNLPLARAVEDDVLLVHTWEGAPLPQEHGGPCRMITPKLYAWKGTKWIRKIEFLAGNKPGLLGRARLFGHGRAVV